VTYQPSSGDCSVLVGRSYGDLIAAHPFHPEAKGLGPDGLPCHERTVGLLHRRPVMVTEIIVIGKEANELDQVDSGLIDELKDVQTIYGRDRLGELRERLRTMTIKEAMALTRFSRRKVMYLRAGVRPKTHPGSQGGETIR
jgi:hypothetical protein